MNLFDVVGLACIGTVIIFWLIFSLGIRHSRPSIADFLLVGVISMIPLFVATCAFLL